MPSPSRILLICTASSNIPRTHLPNKLLHSHLVPIPHMDAISIYSIHLSRLFPLRASPTNTRRNVAVVVRCVLVVRLCAHTQLVSLVSYGIFYIFYNICGGRIGWKVARESVTYMGGIYIYIYWAAQYSSSVEWLDIGWGGKGWIICVHNEDSWSAFRVFVGRTKPNKSIFWYDVHVI